MRLLLLLSVLLFLLIPGCETLGWEVHTTVGRTFNDAKFATTSERSTGFFEPGDEEVVTDSSSSTSYDVDDSTFAALTFVLKGPTPIKIISEPPPPLPLPPPPPPRLRFSDESVDLLEAAAFTIPHSRLDLRYDGRNTTITGEHEHEDEHEETDEETAARTDDDDDDEENDDEENEEYDALVAMLTKIGYAAGGIVAMIASWFARFKIAFAAVAVKNVVTGNGKKTDEE